MGLWRTLAFMPANRIFHRLIGARMPHILWAQSRPADAQRGVYLGLMHGLASTVYGKSLGIQSLADVARRKDFVRHVPIVTYDEIKPWISPGARRRTECVVAGRHQVVCPKLRHHQRPPQVVAGHE